MIWYMSFLRGIGLFVVCRVGYAGALDVLGFEASGVRGLLCLLQLHSHVI